MAEQRGEKRPRDDDPGAGQEASEISLSIEETNK